MNVMIIGSGGREYSIGLKFFEDKSVEKLYFAPGNGATDKFGKNVQYSSYEELAEFALQHTIDLTVVGPEAPLVDGVVDIFKAKGLTIFGPSKKAAQLEGSKVYMKNFLNKYSIPTARYIETDSLEDAKVFISSLPTPIVVKADGLCAGKGVIIASTHQEAEQAASEMLSGERFGDAGKKVIVEEYLDGYELSMFAICDGKDFILLPAAQDHKRLLDNDEGPNTGGMGAYAPTPLVDELLYEKVKERVIKPTLQGMQQEGAPYEGVLFIGLMIINNEPKVLEYNVRFGDPECEVLMPLLKTDASELFYNAATSQLDKINVEISDQVAVGIVMASENYPYGKSKPSEIIVDEMVHEELNDTIISYAGVAKEEEILYATGGRVLVCIGLGESVEEARNKAYELCGQVHFAGKKLRTDIAYQALAQ